MTMPDTSPAPDRVTAYLAEVKFDLDGPGPRPLPYIARRHAPALLGAVEAVLKPHQPGPVTIHGTLCKKHKVCRDFSIDRTEAEHIAACPDCMATAFASCAGCGPHVAFDQCPVRLAIARELPGTKGDSTDAT